MYNQWIIEVEDVRFIPAGSLKWQALLNAVNNLLNYTQKDFSENESNVTKSTRLTYISKAIVTNFFDIQNAF